MARKIFTGIHSQWEWTEVRPGPDPIKLFQRKLGYAEISANQSSQLNFIGPSDWSKF